MALGGRHWFIIGCYLSPNDVVTIECVIAAIFQRPPLGGAAGGPVLQRGPDVAEGDPPWIRDKVEALQQHGTNVLRFHVALVVRHWFVIVCYLSPNDAVTIE